ncbi:MAG: hypothetical protein QOG72_2413 [Sphingomonadales bacterium]|jgi:hypothetical protein|nr:hypothetical protein [Sphingomonadales bacterium]
MKEVQQSRPYNAWDGSAKVYGAIAEVLNHGGTPERALANGRAALDDLRTTVDEDGQG